MLPLEIQYFAGREQYFLIAECIPKIKVFLLYNILLYNILCLASWCLWRKDWFHSTPVSHEKVAWVIFRAYGLGMELHVLNEFQQISCALLLLHLCCYRGKINSVFQESNSGWIEGVPVSCSLVLIFQGVCIPLGIEVFKNSHKFMSTWGSFPEKWPNLWNTHKREKKYDRGFQYFEKYDQEFQCIEKYNPISFWSFSSMTHFSQQTAAGHVLSSFLFLPW